MNMILHLKIKTKKLEYDQVATLVNMFNYCYFYAIDKNQAQLYEVKKNVAETCGEIGGIVRFECIYYICEESVYFIFFFVSPSLNVYLTFLLCVWHRWFLVEIKAHKYKVTFLRKAQ